MQAVIILATVHVVIMGDLHVLWYTINELELCKGSFCLKVLGCLTSALHVRTSQPKQTDYLVESLQCICHITAELTGQSWADTLQGA